MIGEPAKDASDFRTHIHNRMIIFRRTEAREAREHTDQIADDDSVCARLSKK